MTKNKHTGCFNWVQRRKTSVSERWTKMRNRLKRQIYQDDKNLGDAKTVLEEAGARDYGDVKSSSMISDSALLLPQEETLSSKTSPYDIFEPRDWELLDLQADSELHHHDNVPDVKQSDQELSKFIRGIIAKSAIKLATERQADTKSSTSSNDSEIAESAVTFTLTSLVAPDNTGIDFVQNTISMGSKVNDDVQGRKESSGEEESDGDIDTNNSQVAQI